PARGRRRAAGRAVPAGAVSPAAIRVAHDLRRPRGAVRGRRSASGRSRASTLDVAMKRYHVTTFGCQMNEHDSERMKGMLESLGYSEASDRADADLILFNTCSIREKADERFIQHLYEARAL